MLVRQVLESNQEMTKRLRALERQNSVARSAHRSMNEPMEAHNDEGSTIRPRRQNSSNSNRTVLRSLSRTTAYPFTFDQVLQRTRVYSRSAGLLDRRSSGISFSSSAVRSVGWSMLSGLSVSDVSNISVLALPISRDDLYNQQHFGTNHDLGLDLSESPPTNSQEPDCNNLTFKPFDNALDDPCSVFITTALRKHKILAPSWRYSLCIIYAGSLGVRSVELGELPMRLFRQLETERENPSFRLELKPSDMQTSVPCFEDYSQVKDHWTEYYVLENIFGLTECDLEMHQILSETFGFTGRGIVRDTTIVGLKSQQLLSPEDKLSNALRLLSQAEQLDDAQDYEGALNGYGSGCGLLQQVMNGCMLYSQWREIRLVVSTSSTISSCQSSLVCEA